MDKQITELLHTENGTLKINSNFILRRWTKNGLGMPVDMLIIESTINGCNFSREIKKRSLIQIKEEILQAMDACFNGLKYESLKAFKNGYLLGDVVKEA